MSGSRATVISSVRNPLLKQVRRALEHGTLTPDGLCVAEGFHLFEEALRSRAKIETVLSPAPPPGDAEWIEVSDSALAGIATTETSPKIISLVRLPQWTEADLFKASPLIAVLDGLQDPGNAGTILRSAEAFGATGVIFRSNTVSPYNAKLLRASAGSIFRVPFLTGDPEISVPIFAADPHRGKPITEVNWTSPCAIAIGSEAHGIRPDLAARATPVRIPTRGVESLNAGISASLILYEIARQRGLI